MPLTDSSTVLTPQEQLAARLADPATMDSLNRLIDRLDVISVSVEMLDGFFRRGDQIADNVSDSIAEFRGSQKDDGEMLGLVEKLPQLARAGTKMADVANSPSVDRLLASGLLERLAEPNTIAGITALLDRLDLLVFTVKAADEFLRRGDEIADNVADSMDDLKKLASSVDSAEIRKVAESLPQLSEAAHQFLESGMLSRVSELTQAGMVLSDAGFFDPNTVKPLAEMGRIAAESYVAAKSAPTRQYGIFDLMKLLKEPAVQKAINIGAGMARHFGTKV
ncbi:MAG TPA: DUF1641 domain-containing protein [Edaphobacter sp.]